MPNPLRDDPLAERLKTFLSEAGPHLRSGPKPATVVPAAERVGHLLSALRGPLAASRQNYYAIGDIWRIVGLGRNEVLTARVLTWLFDPRGSHGMGSEIITAFWERIPPAVRPFELPLARRASRETVPLGDAGNRVDIEIEGDDFVLFIEVKIDAIEGDRQISRYQTLAREKASFAGKTHASVIFLAPSAPASLPPSCFHLRWQDVAAAIDKVLRRTKHPDSPGAILAAGFSDHAKRL